MAEQCLIVELGTNTVKALIARHSENGWKISSDSIYCIRPGRNLAKSGIIDAENLSGCINLMHDLVNECMQKDTTDVYVIATEFLRRAENREEFVEAVNSKLGLQIKLLSHEEEARLAYLAVLYGFGSLAGKLAVIDIGGGSTELIWGEGENIGGRFSRPIGAVNVAELFFHSDPPYSEEVKQAKEYIKSHLPFDDNLGKTENKYVIGGTATTLALLNEFGTYPSGEEITVALNKINNCTLTLRAVNDMANLFQSVTQRELVKTYCLPPERADIILGGTLILAEIMARMGRQAIKVSTYGIRHGFLFSMETLPNFRKKPCI